VTPAPTWIESGAAALHLHPPDDEIRAGVEVHAVAGREIDAQVFQDAAVEATRSNIDPDARSVDHAVEDVDVVRIQDLNADAPVRLDHEAVQVQVDAPRADPDDRCSRPDRDCGSAHTFPSS
jgi:hypothetical protein